MRYQTYDKAGNIIRNATHGCWGQLTTSYNSPGVRVDKIRYLINRDSLLLGELKAQYLVDDLDVFKTFFKGFDVTVEARDNDPNSLAVWVCFNNLADKNIQETMQRLFALRNLLEGGYGSRTFVQKCKKAGLSLTATCLINAHFKCQRYNSLNLNSPERVYFTASSMGSGALFWNTTVSEFRKFLKGDFEAAALTGNEKLWGNYHGYTSGASGRFVNSACNGAPVGSVLLKAFFCDTVPARARLYYNHSRNREGVDQKHGTFYSDGLTEEAFFNLVKAIASKKKLPELPVKWVKSSECPINPFIKTVQL